MHYYKDQILQNMVSDDRNSDKLDEPPPKLPAKDTFCKAVNSYMQYLYTASRSHADASKLYIHLKQCTKIIHGSMTGSDEFSDVRPRSLEIASIVDIGLDNDVRQNGRLDLYDLEEEAYRGSAFRDFRTDLQECNSNTHTRIITLACTDLLHEPYIATGEPRPSEVHGALSVLFSAMTLGVEFDIRPSVIHRMFLFAQKEEEDEKHFFRVQPERLLFFPDSRTSALWLGRRTFGQAQPFAVIVFIANNDAYVDEQPTIPAPPYSVAFKSASSNSGDDKCGIFMRTKQFIEMLRGSCWQERPTEHSAARTHWLSTLITMEFVTTDHRKESDRRRGTTYEFSSYNRIEIRDVEYMLNNLEKFRWELCCLKTQIVALSEDDRRLDLSDAKSELQAIDRLLSEATDFENHLKTNMNITNASMAHETAQRSIKETRNAWRLTVLAYIFAPLSLASSIFGMNIKEINATGHSVWIVILLALAMLVTPYLAWFLWMCAKQARHNWKHLLKCMRSYQYDYVECERGFIFRALRGLEEFDLAIKQGREKGYDEDWSEYVWMMKKCTATQRLAIILGLRSPEERMAALREEGEGYFQQFTD